MNYKGQIAAGIFIEVMDYTFRAPQVVRSNDEDLQTFIGRGFEHIRNRDGNPSVLYRVDKEVSGNMPSHRTDPGIRSMMPEDLEPIEQIFLEEYPLRYRMVKKLYDYDPEACFLFEEGGQIKGVIFNERKGDHLYSHQLLVRKSHGERGQIRY